MIQRGLPFLVLFLAAMPAGAAGVKVLFDPSKPEIGPFPTDYLTAPATNTRTARVVRMPQPDNCSARPNACQEAFLASQFDGFHVQARVRVTFSAPVNPQTLKEGILLMARENLTQDEKGVHSTGEIYRLNQIVYDSRSNTAYGKPDTAMDQHRRYLIVVTEAVKDTSGDPVEADSAFTACLEASDDYCKGLADALKAAAIQSKVAAAGIYTTMSATSWLERARARLTDVSTAVTPNQGRSFFPYSELRGIAWRQQLRLPSTFEDLVFPVQFLTGVGGIYFGSFSSPNYLNADRVIDPAPSGEELPPAPAVGEVQFHSFLPAGEKPAKGFPVVIYGHGLGDSRFGGPSVLAPTFAGNGMATVAISAPGHGGGPGSHVLVVTTVGSDATIAAPGRAVDIDNNGRFDPGEGCAAVPSSPLGYRDCMRQTAVDLMQLVRVIRAGLDVDGDGTPDFDPDRIYYAGQSLGAMYGTLLLAVEPNIKVAALNSGGGSVIDIVRWSSSLGPAIAQSLRLRLPALNFNQDYVLRDYPVKVVSDPNAIEVQNTLETIEWLQSEGDPAVYASHLKPSPLPGNAGKRVLFQFAQGDRTVPNPAQSTLVRHADMRGSTWIYRHDKARQVSQTLSANPHTYLTDLGFASLIIARPVQSQISGFLLSDGMNMGNPNDGVSFFFRGNIFEMPDVLPEDLNYLEP